MPESGRSKLPLRTRLFPWAALRRVMMHVENPPQAVWPKPADERQEGWEQGYDRAMFDVGWALGVDRDA